VGDKSGRRVGLTTLLPSRADCVEILGVSTSCNQLGLNRPVQGLPYLLPLHYQLQTEPKTNFGTFHNASFHFTFISYLSLTAEIAQSV
jgi:hypothetical protein